MTGVPCAFCDNCIETPTSDYCEQHARGAAINEARTHRFMLWRRWSLHKPDLGWVMLNPSTADEAVDDPTIRKVRHYTEREGFGGFVVVNLFTLRATNPLDLFGRHDAQDEAEMWLRRLARMQVVCAWGAHKVAERAGPWALGVLRAQGSTLWCLGKTKDGHPRHPLYLKNMQPFEPMM